MQRLIGYPAPGSAVAPTAGSKCVEALGNCPVCRPLNPPWLLQLMVPLLQLLQLMVQLVRCLMHRVAVTQWFALHRRSAAAAARFSFVAGEPVMITAASAMAPRARCRPAKITIKLTIMSTLFAHLIARIDAQSPTSRSSGTRPLLRYINCTSTVKLSFFFFSMLIDE